VWEAGEGVLKECQLEMCEEINGREDVRRLALGIGAHLRCGLKRALLGARRGL
jgi:hypothetical protein